MPLPAMADVRAVLQKHEECLRQIALGSWDDWRSSGLPGVWRSKRGRAVFVWEQMIARAHAEFDGVQGIRILDGHETFKFLVDDVVLFRLKKGDEKGLSANAPTQTALAFHDHDQDLFGMSEVMRVDVVYQLNRLETAVDDILVVCRDGDRVAWTYSIKDEEAGSATAPVDLPQAPPPPAERLVRARTEPVPKEQNARD